MSQVSDYDIANASGASVRSDINLVLDAVKTLNSGSSDPTNAQPFMLYGDTSDNKLKIRNSANSSFTEIGDINQANLGLLPIDGSTAMTGALQLRTTGSASNLPVKFSGDTDTGFGRFAENTLSFVCGGTERLTLTSTLLELGSGVDLKFKNGSVGIKFEYNGSGNVNFALPNADGANGSVLQTNGSGQLSFVAIQGVPTGTIFCFAIATVPAGYLECNGQSTSGHAALAALIGSNVPDLRGEFVRGWASNRAVDTGRQIGSTQGDENKSHNHSVTSSHTINDPGHRHSPSSGTPSSTQGDGQTLAVNNRIIGNYGGGSGNGLGPLGNRQFMNDATTGISVSTNNTVSNSGGTESRPRNVALMYIIKT
tara:strand:+ start:327 stop:1430 length:1104 start_codon:yes stop_codon:yes gene_type:complete